MSWSIVPAPPVPQAGEKFFDAGGSTFHTHTCVESGDRLKHTWRCNSPYCNNLLRDCPEHGGKDPVTIGEEPWR